GAYFILYPGSRVLTYIFPVFFVHIPAWIFLGLWFLYQLIEANFGLFSASANGGGVAFFAHVGGFVFGALVTWLLTRTRRVAPQTQYQHPCPRQHPGLIPASTPAWNGSGVSSSLACRTEYRRPVPAGSSTAT